MSHVVQMAAAATRWFRTYGFRTYEFTAARSLYAGQALFALGWALLWATALALVTFLPLGVSLLLMAAGLACPAAQRWRKSNS